MRAATFPLLLLLLCVSFASDLLAAENTASAKEKPAPAKDEAKPAETPAQEPALELPKIEVRQSRIHEIDVAIHKLDKLITREEKKIKPTELDKVLNNSKLAKAAAIFGGNSAEHLAEIAATRLALLVSERDVLESMKRPATLESLAMMEKELDQLRTTRRNLDNVDR